MMKFFKGLLIVIGGFVMFVIVLGAIVAGAAAHKRDEESRRVTSGASGNAAIHVSSDQLHHDYVANEVSADARYRGHILVVTGAVRVIKKDVFDKPYLTLWTEDEFHTVDARFDESANSSLANVHQGQHVTVRCIGNNVILNCPQLESCVLQ